VTSVTGDMTPHSHTLVGGEKQKRVRERVELRPQTTPSTLTVSVRASGFGRMPDRRNDPSAKGGLGTSRGHPVPPPRQRVWTGARGYQYTVGAVARRDGPQHDLTTRGTIVLVMYTRQMSDDYGGEGVNP
jgi:hypothetical protein